MKTGKAHNVFINGPIPAQLVGDLVEKHNTKTATGAHGIFLGQVRADAIADKTVAAIEFSAYEEMATEMFGDIREAVFGSYPISCLHIHHSLGTVNAGGICLLVFVSSPHRDAALDACRWVVEQIKMNVPVWGKEIFQDQSHTWKKNILKNKIS
jgi:molybdopterin synthase catalytic subunit